MNGGLQKLYRHLRSLVKSFYFKLTLLLFAILTVSSAVQVTVFAEYARKLRLGSDQAIQAHLARDTSAELRKRNVNLSHPEQLAGVIEKWTLSTPNAVAYLIDERGVPRFSPGKDVSGLVPVALADVSEFLAGGRFPNFGVNPANPDRREVFSVAPIELSDFRGYLYLILDSEIYRTGASDVANLFILRSVVYQALLGMLIAGGLGLLLFFLLTKRLRRMSGTLQDFAAGRSDVRIPSSGDDELDQLAVSFNEMADSIASSKYQLEEQDALRRRLVANISHDLRSPLTALSGYCETLIEFGERLSSSSREDIIRIISGNAKLLSRIVDDLFALSMLEAKERPLHCSAFDLHACIDDLLLSFELRASEQQVALRYDTPPDAGEPLLVFADEQLVIRVLANLLENAVLHAKSDSTVTIKTERTEASVSISVANFGPILSAEECKSIFERFHRGDRGAIRKSEGAGLGLAIVKRILELHDRTIEVKSDEETGTIFSCSLPVAI